MPRALVRVVGSDSGALSLTAVQAAVTKKTKAASAFAFASFATASFEEVERTEGVAQGRRLLREDEGPPAHPVGAELQESLVPAAARRRLDGALEQRRQLDRLPVDQ